MCGHELSFRSFDIDLVWGDDLDTGAANRPCDDAFGGLDAVGCIDHSVAILLDDGAMRFDDGAKRFDDGAKHPADAVAKHAAAKHAAATKHLVFYFEAIVSFSQPHPQNERLKVRKPSF